MLTFEKADIYRHVKVLMGKDRITQKTGLPNHWASIPEL
jgi:hypothetical protein